MTTPMLAQFKRKLTSSAILIKKKEKENPKRPAQVYMHFVLYGVINLKQIVFSILFNFITTFKHVYINQCIKDLYSLVFENTVSQFYRYMSTNKHKKVSM